MDKSSLLKLLTGTCNNWTQKCMHALIHTHTHTHTHTHRHLEWHNLEATVRGDNSIEVRNVVNDAREQLEFHERIIKTSLGWGHLVVTMATQCYIYK